VTWANRALAEPAQDQFAVGAAHYTQRRWQLAADEFQAFLQQFPLHEKAASARFFRGEALLQVRNYDEARREYRRYLEHFADGEYGRQAEFRVGEIGYLLADGKQARADLQGYLRRYPHDPLNAQVLTYLGQLALDAGDAQFAAENFRQALNQFPESELAPACRFGLARALEKQGDPRAASQLFEQLAAEGGNLTSDALMHLAACRYEDAQYDAAIAALDRLAREYPQNRYADRASMLRGWSLFELGRYRESVVEFRRLATGDESSAEAQYWYGLAQKKLGEWQQAAETLSAAAKAQPDGRWAAAMHYHAGDAWLLAQHSAQADDEFAAVLRFPESEWVDDALLGQTRVALAKGDYERVEKLVAQHATEHAGGALQRDFQRALAAAYINSGRPAAAIDLLAELVRDDAAGSAHERRLLAQAYQRAGNNEQALEVLSQLPPGESDHEVLLTRGLALLCLERFAEALPCFEVCIARHAEGPTAALALAEACYCQLKLGDSDRARVSYARLCREFADEAVLVPAVQRLADLALTSGEVDFAQELYERLSAQQTSTDAAAQGLFGLGRIAFRQADYFTAADRLRELIATYPDSCYLAEARLLGGTALEKSGNSDAAQAMFRQVYQQHADSPLAAQAMLAAARLHRKSKQSKEAIELYQWLIDRSDSVVAKDMALYELAWVLRDNDAPDEAEAYFRRIHDDFPASTYWADATYRLAEQARISGQSGAAAELLDQLIASDSAGSLREYALYLRGQIAAEMQEWSRTASAMQRLLDEHPASPLVRQAEFWLAEALYRQNDWEAAAERFERLTAAASGNEDWLALVTLRRAQIRAQREDWDTAYEIASTISAAFPNFRQQHEVDYLLGRCLANEARFEDARAAYKRATQSESGGKSEVAAMAQWMIGESFFHQRDYEAAIQAYLRVEILYAYPTWQAAALLQAGKCYELLGQQAKAIELYSRLVEVYPETQFADEAARRLSLAKKPENSERS
jgi:TolA-binding protein